MVEILFALLPPVFILHELEEILLYPTWTRRHQEMLLRRVPLLRGKLPFLQSPAFVLAVAEQLLIISGLTLATLCTGHTLYALFALWAFALHLLPHLAQPLLLRRYVPATISSLWALPYCIYTLSHFCNSYTPTQHAALACTAALFCMANLWAMHALCPRLWARIEKQLLK